MDCKPEDISLKNAYKLITGSIVPRPIAWVSSVNHAGQPNLAPYSFFNVVCSKPPTILFCPGVRAIDGKNKDTLENVRASGEFVVNLVTEELAEAMNLTATELPADVNEFEFGGVTQIPSELVKPPRVAESPINFECKVTQIVDIGDGGKGSASIVIGEIIYLHIAEEVLLPNYKINIQALKPIGRLAGPNYSKITETIEIFRLPTQIQPE
ncbi:MAG: flavin reductase family protein [Chloroflexi bacterium]|nr:flavin reductase family protein [Chloroflexota bacterium]